VQKAKCDAYTLFCGTNSHTRRAEDQPGVGIFLKEFLTTPTSPNQTPSESDYTDLIVVAVFKHSRYITGRAAYVMRLFWTVPSRCTWAHIGGGHGGHVPQFLRWGDIICHVPPLFLFRFCIWRSSKSKSDVCHVVREVLFMLDVIHSQVDVETELGVVSLDSVSLSILASIK